jgi:MFS family permease
MTCDLRLPRGSGGRPSRESAGAALGLLTGLNAISYLDRRVGAATLPLILTTLALSDAAGGFLHSAFVVAYVLICPLAGWLGDRRSRMKLAGLGALIWSAATGASGLAPSYASLLFTRMAVGIGEAMYAVVTPSLLADYYTAAGRAQALGLFYAATPVGTALGYMLGGLIGPRYGWRAAFFVAAAPGAVLALLLLLFPEPPRGRLDGARARITTPLGLRPSLRALASRRSYIVNTAARALYTFATGGLATWIPTYVVRERGVPLSVAASTFGLLLVVAGSVGAVIGGRLSSRLAARGGAEFAVAGWSLIASMGFGLLAILSPAPAVYWPAMFVTLLLAFVNVGPLTAAMANVLPADLRGRGFALATMVIHLLGDAASPWLIGMVSDRFGLRLPVLATGCLLGGAGVVLLAGRKALREDVRQLVEASPE